MSRFKINRNRRVRRSVINNRKNRVNEVFDQLETIGNRHQRQSIVTMRRVLEEIENWALRHGVRRAVTITKDYTCVIPVSVVVERVGVSVQTAWGYLMLLSILGFINRVGHEFNETKKAWIGRSGIRAQLYQFPNVGVRKSREIVALWTLWCNRGGSTRRITKNYLINIFGSRAEKQYQTPEAAHTEEGRKLREEYLRELEDSNHWQNREPGYRSRVRLEQRRNAIKIREAFRKYNRTKNERVNGRWVRVPDDRRFVWMKDKEGRWFRMSIQILRAVLKVYKALQIDYQCFSKDRCYVNVLSCFCRSSFDSRRIDLCNRVWRVVMRWLSYWKFDEEYLAREDVNHPVNLEEIFDNPLGLKETFDV